MKRESHINRRNFIGAAVATTAGLSIVPSRVIAGMGKTPPSDKINVAVIGCGTQSLREMPRLLQHDHIQVVSVCDPNTYSTDYLDWSPHGIRNSIRATLNDPSWGEGIEGIAGGRDVGQQYVNQYYANNLPSGSYKGCTAYEDFRELLEKEQDVDAIKIMTPDHLHATIAIAAMYKKKHVITHKPIANRLMEGRKTIHAAQKNKVITHLLAWRYRPGYDLIKTWMDDGIIGKLKEIHNWSYRPVWPQWPAKPQEVMPIPKGFNWELWLGPVPDRPYHKNYTHNVFRGWYDFGGGSIADMGHYSLFPLFTKLGIDRSPVSVKAYGTTMREVEDNVCKWINNDVAFPHSSMIRFKFPEQKTLPAFDLFWYDGGMKPFAPEELAEDGEDIPNEGMMFVGDKGKILAGFRGEAPRIIPTKKMNAYSGDKQLPEESNELNSDIWSRAILEQNESPGSFLYAQTITDTINLAAIALRTKERIEFDEKQMKITNIPEANQYLTRDYRKGWEL